MNDNLIKALHASLTPYDYHQYANVAPIEVETFTLTPLPKYVNDEEAIKAHANDNPLKQLHCGYSRLGYMLPLTTFEKNCIEDTWTCKLHEGERIHEGKSRDRQIANNIAATYLLDSMIEQGKSDKFFLPKDKEIAHECIDLKRKKLFELTETKNLPNPYKCIAEYAQFYKIAFSACETANANSFSSTVTFDGQLYTAKGISKKEARKNAANIVYTELLISNKYSEYKLAQEKAIKERKLKNAKFHISKEKVAPALMDSGNNSDTFQ